MRTYISKLPRVGDRIMRPMTHNQIWKDDGIEPCIVTYVNKDKNWYQVTFVNSGIKECYKCPDYDPLSEFKKEYERAFGKKAKGVYVYESGKMYSKISDCAKDIGVPACSISKHIHGGSSHVKGYHIYVL